MGREERYLWIVPPPDQPEIRKAPEVVLVAVRAAPSLEMTWARPRSDERRYELLSGRIRVATLDEGKDDGTVEAATAGRRWLILASGNAWRRIEIHDAASGQAVGRFQERWSGGGVLEVARGDRMALTPANFWHSEWVWKDEAGAVLLRWQNWEQTWEPDGRKSPHADLLAVLSWAIVLFAARTGRASASDELIGVEE